MKKDYKKPQCTNLTQEAQAGIGGALKGAAYMVGRSAAKAMKGDIDVTLGTDKVTTLQDMSDVPDILDMPEKK